MNRLTHWTASTSEPIMAEVGFLQCEMAHTVGGQLKVSRPRWFRYFIDLIEPSGRRAGFHDLKYFSQSD